MFGSRSPPPIDVIVQLARLRDGRRVVWEVAVVEGSRHGEPVVESVFGFRPRSADGGFEATGYIPSIADIAPDAR